MGKWAFAEVGERGVDEARPSDTADYCVTQSLRYSPYIEYGCVSLFPRALYARPLDANLYPDAASGFEEESRPLRHGFPPARLGEGAGLHCLRLKMGDWLCTIS